VSVEERVRTAAEATAATVREIRPLILPPEAAPAPARRRRFPRSAGGWGGWLIPLTAAVAVIVVAAILVTVRDLPGAGHASAPTPAGYGHAATGVPRYGVVLTEAGGSGVQYSNLSVVDTHTGKQMAQVKHPAGVSFQGVSGAADDRTFAVSAVITSVQPLSGNSEMQAVRVWYLLRVAPGSAQPVTLTRLAVPGLAGDAVIDGMALSPDGRTLAVLDWCTVAGPCYQGSPGTLQLYSVATGKALRVWKWGTSPDPTDPIPSYAESIGPNENSAGLTWLAGGRTLAFTYYAHGQAPAVRTLDTSRPGNDLVAASRRVFTLPATGPDACAEAQLTPDGRTVVCGTHLSAFSGCDSVKKETLEIDAYSAATGKRESVLYRYTGPCTQDGIGALGWVGPGNTVVAMVDTGTVYTKNTGSEILHGFLQKVVVGVVSGGKLIALLPATLPFEQGPGMIAF
jgi:hypothetical protein